MNFTDNQNLHIGISEKKDGPMKNSPENRLLFFKNHHLDTKIIISAGLIHKDKVVVISKTDKHSFISNCDALITNQNNCLLTITVADCLPIYFYDKNKKVIALAHAGWRGVTSKIVTKVIEAFTNHYDSDINDIEVFIGPHIKDCHFEIKDNILSQFETSGLVIRNSKTYVNLSKIVKNQLLQLKINSKSINISEECTYCLSDKYFSFRKGAPKELDTMIAYIGLK